MDQTDPAYPERPAKRVRQACEPCRRPRRKKAKCPGEQPVCSLCAETQAAMRLRGREASTSSGGSLQKQQRGSASVAHIGRNIGSKPWRKSSKISLGGQVEKPRRQTWSSPIRGMALLILPFQLWDPPVTSLSAVLPPWDEIMPIAELYLLYCDSQPLPLFHRSSFLASLPTRDVEIIYAIFALSLRFSDTYHNSRDLAEQVNGYAEVARGLVMKRVSEGPVEVSTLQCLCLLSLVDFTSMIHPRFEKSAGVASGAYVFLSDYMAGNFQPPTWAVHHIHRVHPGPQELCPQGLRHLPELRNTCNFEEDPATSRRGLLIPSTPKILAIQMEMETRMPLTHRYKPANLSDRSLEELQAHREYWGPWFLNQFIYHTILCLLNHPLLLSLSLRTFRSTIPEIFLQHTSDLISSHTTWIIHFINYFEEKSFLVSDPLLGYSAAVVATIELQLSFTDNPTIREQKRERFTQCVQFVQRIGQRWPHMARLARRLQHLEDAVSATYQPDPDTENQSLLIDLSRFWEILEYSSNNDTDSARRLFGDSLCTGPPPVAAEVSQTSPLPAPSRLNASDEHSSSGVQHQSFGAETGAGPGRMLHLMGHRIIQRVGYSRRSN
ncbi:C6 transcription factor [Penicillium cosmopolitanum]|uniref:C6 transcription factor n=1 Tax=Penicillium cosmopolitanum TaxID=1131564 RepID=A0A9W9WBL7_9EURO|nr:C6 transcription factor [Penicillium cosmopolitanum]KAJ5414353.1 C6 transcription factor [Penicillium cosmopolitanum]